MSSSSFPIYPLSPFGGAAPDAPAWFNRALAASYDVLSVEVRGARIEARAWGERGAPGLILLHGSSAHLGWWAPLAPFFADRFRVAALSFSGMGASDWRASYSMDDYIEEMWAVARAAGLLDQALLPIVVGHSFGGAPVVHLAAEPRPRIRLGVTVDSVMPRPEGKRGAVRPPHKVHPDIASALARFRFSPPQPCENLWMADYLARMALRQESGGWTWRFDPEMWRDLESGDLWTLLGEVRTPFAMIRGEASALSGGDMAERMRAVAPQGTPFVEIPEAHHHVMVDQPLALVAVLRTLFETLA